MNGHFLRPTTSAKSISWVSTIVLGEKKRGPLKSGTDRNFSDLPNGLERLPDFVLFDLQIFSGGVCPPSATSRTISFSISKSFWY